MIFSILWDMENDTDLRGFAEAGASSSLGDLGFLGSSASLGLLLRNPRIEDEPSTLTVPFAMDCWSQVRTRGDEQWMGARGGEGAGRGEGRGERGEGVLRGQPLERILGLQRPWLQSTMARSQGAGSFTEQSATGSLAECSVGGDRQIGVSISTGLG